jgi:hypothetical protein
LLCSLSKDAKEDPTMKIAHIADFTALTMLFGAGYVWMLIA